ncbi:hypothetical protein HQ865_05990 [Mucilaginibacter mali]|uniref:Uncharacterized protein n=1 Tax=Mucilaginibacter mali TaxID=2740462 RepID=A0A7D4Q9G3_9SPHI|nr:hypothetical protein [Mucilaginibacter mali]QKJ29324.1 hypothetical protein HQ865_05990 [Mucilaginibacter mali]
MTIYEILDRFHTENDINTETIAAFQADTALRKELISYSRQNKDRAFALALLDKFITTRRQPDGIMPAEDLMLACFNLGLQNHIEDCLKIWDAKTIDFDTYCGLDIQLVPFAGVTDTISFLQKQNSDEALKALTYICECDACGDFDELDEYFSAKTFPWFI